MSGRSSARRAGIAAAIAILSASISIIVGPWPDVPGSRATATHATLPEMHVRALAGAVANVPDGDPVSATNTVGSHLAERRYLYSVPVVGRAEWIVLDTWDDWMPAAGPREEGDHPDLFRAFQERVEASAEWREVFEQDGVFVFERVVQPSAV